MKKKNQIRVVIMGHSPLPHENLEKNSAPGFRTWGFAKTANDSKCEVLILAGRVTGAYPYNTPEICYEEIDNVRYYSVAKNLFEDKKWIGKKILEFNPDCIVGVNTYPSSILANLDLDIPFWADLNGSIMSEAQAKAFVYDDNSYLNHYFKMESKVLQHADIFSVVSESQGFSLIGELGLQGRLNKETMGFRFVNVIPVKGEKGNFTHNKNVIRNVLAEDSDFVVLYSGGYNTWTDVRTLFHGLENAMSQNPKLVFVSTGGQIDGHDEYTYGSFQKMINSSPFRKRFHLQGWVPHDDLPNYYLEADLGINSDKYSYEAILGSRNRVLDWMKASLPFITTPLSEITRFLVDKGASYEFKSEDSNDLSKKLLEIASQKSDLKLKKSIIKKIYEDEFTSEKIYQSFKKWLENPTYSPDRKTKFSFISEQKKSLTLSQENPPKIQKIAIALWPSIQKVLKRIGLRKYEYKIKKFGEDLALKKPDKKYRAEFNDVQPIEMEIGEQYSIPIRIKNLGTVIWNTPELSEQAVNLSYHWKDENGRTLIHDGIRTPLKKSVKPGHKINMSAKVVTPPQAGKYILEFDMVKENNLWFSEYGSKTCKMNLSVKKKQQEHLKDVKLPKISVVVVTYNSENYITECLNSILASDYPSMEIIVVDNASKDNTLKQLEIFNQKLTLIRSKKNLGFAGGNNLGIKKSKGEILVLINPDAYVTKNSFKELIKPFLTDPKIMITGSKILYPNSKTIQSAGGIIQKNGLTNHIGYKEKDEKQYNFPELVDYVTGAAIAIRRKLFELTGLFDTVYKPAYYEETEKCLQARKLNYKVLYVPKSVVYHHESTTLGVLSKNFLKTFHSSRFKFIYRNYSLSDYLFKFVPSELEWFLFNCTSNEKSIVLKAHLTTIFSPKIKYHKVEF